MRRRGLAIASVLACLARLPDPASAHESSDASLELSVEGAALHGRLDLSLRDLDLAIGLDADLDGAITWGELRAGRGAIEGLIAAGLAIASEAGVCPARVEDVQVEPDLYDAHAVLRLSAACPSAPRSLTLSYALFFDQDPLHMGLARIEARGATATAVFAADARVRRIELD